MLPAPKRREIDHRTLKLIVGVIALTLAGATWLFAGTDIESISGSFWQGGWSQSFFVGSLFAVSAFLLAYNGFSRPEMILSKVAVISAAWGVPGGAVSENGRLRQGPPATRAVIAAAAG